MIHRHTYVAYTLVPPHINATCGIFSFSFLYVLGVMFWLVVKRAVQCVYEKNVSMYLYSNYQCHARVKLHPWKMIAILKLDLTHISDIYALFITKY
jgi:hypothetical protein